MLKARESRVERALSSGRLYESIDLIVGKVDIASTCNEMAEGGYDFLFSVGQAGGGLLTLLFKRREV
jgi:hypothetical protein